MTGLDSEKTNTTKLSVRGFAVCVTDDAKGRSVRRWVPGVVSCADIIIMATRDVSGGELMIQVQMVKRDDLVVLAQNTISLPPPTASVATANQLFALKGLTTTDMIYLLGLAPRGVITKYNSDMKNPAVAVACIYWISGRVLQPVFDSNNMFEMTDIMMTSCIECLSQCRFKTNVGHDSASSSLPLLIFLSSWRMYPNTLTHLDMIFKHFLSSSTSLAIHLYQQHVFAATQQHLFSNNPTKLAL
ncbi:peroxidase 60-like protein [Tanacetum coccineum]